MRQPIMPAPHFQPISIATAAPFPPHPHRPPPSIPVTPTKPQRKRTGYSVEEPNAVIEEGGRPFQSYRRGKYLLPNDGEEQDRLDLQHALFRIVLDNRLACAPIEEEPRYVLDIGSGTGIWALDFAENHPTSNVIGTDLSLIQPYNKRGLRNIDFVREDSEEMWVHPFKFDYVHLRMVCTCFDDTRTVIRHAFDNMNSGGWIEFQDTSLTEMGSLDGTFEGTALQIYMHFIVQGMRNMGRQVEKTSNYRKWLLDAGFVDVVERRIIVPLSPWHPKFINAGRFMQANCLQTIPAMALKLLPAAGLSPAEAEAIIEPAMRDMKNQNIHSTIPLYVVFGRKP